jgi:undecaprenyl phosphate-alpha-L-ara4N flippase subunit ArnE
VTHPVAQVFLASLLVAASEMAKKRGADSAVAQSVIDVSQLRSPWVWLSVILGIGSLLCWLNALRKITLSVAYNLSGMQHVLVPVGSWWLLGEHIGTRQWVGIALVFLGVMITAPAVAHAEEVVEKKEHA